MPRISCDACNGEGSWTSGGYCQHRDKCKSCHGTGIDVKATLTSLETEIAQLRKENKQLMDGPDLERKFWDTFIKGVTQVTFRNCHSDPAEYSGMIDDTIKLFKTERDQCVEALEKIKATARAAISKYDQG